MFCVMTSSLLSWFRTWQCQYNSQDKLSRNVNSNLFIFSTSPSSLNTGEKKSRVRHELAVTETFLFVV